MMSRAFAAWVEPLAAARAADRRQVVAFARAAPAELWARPSVLAGWTNKDLLAHLAGGNDRLLQTVLRAVALGEAPDPGALRPDTDTENARGVRERRGWSLNRLVAELERDGDELQDLLSRLTDRDEALGPPGLGSTLGELLRASIAEHHDLVHLAQLEASLPGAGS
jgi:uncharacterized protein (TIGR03083 family)